jgi:branched-chain amino acid transport system permease protein
MIGNPSTTAAAALPAAPPVVRRATRRVLWLAVLLVLAASMPVLVPNPFYLAVANLVLINAAVAVSLTLLIGTTGQLSLGHAAFFASGAYLSAHLSVARGWPVLLALPCAVLGSTLLAWAVGRLFLKLSGYYLAVATLGIGLLLGIVLRNEQQFSGGPDGMSVGPLEIGRHVLRGDAAWYWLLLAVLALVVGAALNLLRSPAGRALRALHDAEIAATTMGVDVRSYKVRIFVLSGAIAGLMGALYAHYAGFITPASASFVHSVQFLMMAVIGGIGSIGGAVLGAAIVTLLPNLLAGAAEYETLVVGGVLFAAVLFMPRGIVPTLRDRWRARRTGARS